MKRILHLVSLLATVATILSFTSPLAHGQTATCTVSNVGPSGPGLLVAGEVQTLSYTINWTGFPQQQNVSMDVSFEIKNTTKKSTSGKFKLLTLPSHGAVSGTIEGSIFSPVLITPAGSSSDQGSLEVTVTSDAPGNPHGNVFAKPAPTYK